MKHWAVFPDPHEAFENTAILPFVAISRVPGLPPAVQTLMSRVSCGRSAVGRTAKVVLPLSFPGLVAGSIFTFSLTLGDYITPILVGGPGSDFIGNVVYSNVGIANNVPFAAAMALVPMAIMALYLLGARALGAFEEV